MSMNKELEAAAERSAAAVIRGKQLTLLAHKAVETLRVHLEDLEDQLRIIMAFDPPESVKALQRRVDKIQEHRRAMELGSLTLEAEKALSEAWRRIPG